MNTMTKMTKKEQYEKKAEYIYLNAEVEIDFGDFMEICDNLEIPVLEIEIYTNPFAGIYNKKTETKYESLGEYSCANDLFEYIVRYYDYELDMLDNYRNISAEEFLDGKFTMYAFCFSHSDRYCEFELKDDYLEIIYHVNIND